MSPLEVAFERDLRAWVARVYERRAGLNRRRLEERVFQILESEKRWLVPLTVGVLLGVAAFPLFGAVGLLGSLVLLYVGAVASGIRTMRRAEKVERSVDPRREAQAATARAWESRPPLGAEERARLVRIMNLSHAATLPTVRPALLDELREARAEEPLASWPFLDDLADLLRVDAAALA